MQSSQAEASPKRKRCPACGESFDDSQGQCPVDGLLLCQDDPLLGAIFDERFEVLSLLGQGATSVVYKARQMGLERLVALKLLKTQTLTDTSILKRLKLEAQAASHLEHPNIGRVFSCGVDGTGQPYLAMELIDGKSLAALLSEQQPLPFQSGIDLFVQLARALDHAHQRGIVHRDLKPSNVMVCTKEDGKQTCKIVDFGTAKFLQSALAEDLRLTRTGEVLGTILYMSPEQRRGDELDGRSDIYSLGYMLFEAFSANGELPSELFPIVQRALEQDVQQRYQYANELADDLEAVLKGEPKRGTLTLRSRTVLVPQRRKLIYAALLILFILAAVAAALPLFDQKKNLETTYLLERTLGFPRKEVMDALLDQYIADSRFDQAENVILNEQRASQDGAYIWYLQFRLIDLFRLQGRFNEWVGSQSVMEDWRQTALWYRDSRFAVLEDYIATLCDRIFPDPPEKPLHFYDELNLKLNSVNAKTACIRILERLVELSSRRPSAEELCLKSQERLASRYMETRCWQPALLVCQDMIKRAKEVGGERSHYLAVAYGLAGRCCEHLQRYPEALSYCKKALATERFLPGEHHVWIAMGETLLDCGDYKGSLHAFEMAEKTRPASDHIDSFARTSLGKAKSLRFLNRMPEWEVAMEPKLVVYEDCSPTVISALFRESLLGAKRMNCLDQQSEAIHRLLRKWGQAGYRQSMIADYSLECGETCAMAGRADLAKMWFEECFDAHGGDARKRIVLQLALIYALQGSVQERANFALRLVRMCRSGNVLLRTFSLTALAILQEADNQHDAAERSWQFALSSPGEFLWTALEFDSILLLRGNALLRTEGRDAAVNFASAVLAKRKAEKVDYDLISSSERTLQAFKEGRLRALWE